MDKQVMQAVLEGNCLVKKFFICRDDSVNPDKYVCRTGDRLFSRFFYITKGTFLLTNKSGTQLVADAGTIIYLPSDLEYDSEWKAPGKGGYISFTFFLTDPMGQHMALAEEAVVIAKDKKGNIKTLFERADQYYRQYERFVDLKLTALFYQIVYDIFREIERKTYKEEEATREIYKAMIYLNDNYMSKVTTEELALMCNLSEATFRRYFRAYNKVSPLKYKNHLRMLHAQEMLRSGFYTVSEVSEIVECSDLSHFNKLYRSEFGKNPSDDIPHFE